MHYLGGLNNEFVINFYSGIEAEKLTYLRNNQLQVCPKRFLDSSDTVARVCLPASFLGSKRYFQSKTADGLAIVR